MSSDRNQKGWKRLARTGQSDKFGLGPTARATWWAKSAARALSSVTGPPQSHPGEKYAYGNQGMNVAARVVEIVSGMPYEEFRGVVYEQLLDAIATHRVAD